jgi:hypothetical protein
MFPGPIDYFCFGFACGSAVVGAYSIWRSWKLMLQIAREKGL